MKRFLGSLILVLLAGGVTFAQSELQPIANVKLVKTEPITLRQLKARCEVFQKEIGRAMSVDEKKQVLDTMINERLVVQAAERDGVRVSDAEVNQGFSQMIAQQMGKELTEAEIAQIIKQQTGQTLDEYMKSQNGMTLAEYKSFLRSQLVAQRYVGIKKGEQIKNAPAPSDADIRAFYEINKQNFVMPDVTKIFLVMAPKGDAPAAAQAKVAEIQKQLKDKPASASEIKIRSQAEGSGYQAGDMYINKDSVAAKQLGISMEALLKIFAMQKNEVSDITETAKDFQCFIVLEKFSAKILEIGDVVKPGTTVTVYEYIKRNLGAQSQSRAVNAALIELINELRQGESFQILKSGADLEKALSW